MESLRESPIGLLGDSSLSLPGLERLLIFSDREAGGSMKQQAPHKFQNPPLENVIGDNEHADQD